MQRAGRWNRRSDGSRDCRRSYKSDFGAAA